MRRKMPNHWQSEVCHRRLIKIDRESCVCLVMRLSKPALYQNIPVYAEEESSSSSAAFLAGQSQDIALGNDQSVLSHLLLLPYSFGFVSSSFLVLIAFLVSRNVFLGEVFSAIVSLHNQSEHLLKEVLLKVRRSICSSLFGDFSLLDRHPDSNTTDLSELHGSE